MQSIRATNKQLTKWIFALGIGLGGCVEGARYYPPLDGNPLAALELCVFFLPILIHVVLTVRKRLGSNVEWLRKLYFCFGSFLILLACSLFLNGAMDRSPLTPIRTSILYKTITTGKYSSTHHLIVTSWRAGNRTENLSVDRDTYLNMVIGERVVVEVRRGLFGLTWYGGVTPDR